MLTLTENATTIVKQITEQPETNALRIAGDGDDSLAVTAVTGAQPDDQVVEQDGATVYLDPAAATMLEDKVLDAGMDESGNLQFALALQA